MDLALIQLKDLLKFFVFPTKAWGANADLFELRPVNSRVSQLFLLFDCPQTFRLEANLSLSLI